MALSHANSAANLSNDQKHDGFLSIEFSARQFSDMNEDLAVVACVEDNLVKSFLCATTVEFNKAFGLPNAMIERFPQAIYDAKPLSEWCVCITGPVCIDVSLRGQGVLHKLYDCFRTIAPALYELAVVFVSVENPRSIKAHEKLGMRTVDEFEFEQGRYVIMAGRLRG